MVSLFAHNLCDAHKLQPRVFGERGRACTRSKCIMYNDERRRVDVSMSRRPR